MFNVNVSVFTWIIYVFTIFSPILFFVYCYKFYIKYRKFKPIEALLKLSMPIINIVLIFLEVLFIVFLVHVDLHNLKFLTLLNNGTIFFIIQASICICILTNAFIVTNKGIVIVSIIGIPLNIIRWEDIKGYEFLSDYVKFVYLHNNKEKEMLMPISSYDSKKRLISILNQYIKKGNDK